MISYVSLNNVGKVYRSRRGDVEALSRISIDIREGEFLSVVGPSGCGKSTLLKCVAGLDVISSGRLTIRGRDMAGPPDSLGIVFQRDVLLDWRTVLDNVLLPIEFESADNDKNKYVKRANELLELFGLNGFQNRYPWELSGGMRQRAAISRALLRDPSLLLMDEPFGAVDALTRDVLNIELQRIWNETKKTVIFITHSIAEAVLLSDRIAVMKRNPGEIVEIVEIDIPRPRNLAMRETSEFGKYARHIRETFERLGFYK
jgi:NitT/TauT family transport system ATP-binding protein